jgi:biopolymer transport protein ExbD
MAGGGGGGEVEVSGKGVFGDAMPAEVDLNLTALMDILSNLLFFLLASFGATILMSVNASTPVQSADRSDAPTVKNAVTVNVKVAKTGFEVTASGTAQTPEELAALGRKIAAAPDGLDFPKLAEQLLAIKGKYPQSDTLILIPEAGVSYESLIKTMDAARQKDINVAGDKHNVKMFPNVVVTTVVK